MLREIHLMNIKRLSEIVDKLTLTPKSLAVRYLHMGSRVARSEEPNPARRLAERVQETHRP